MSGISQTNKSIFIQFEGDPGPFIIPIVISTKKKNKGLIYKEFKSKLLAKKIIKSRYFFLDEKTFASINAIIKQSFSEIGEHNVTWGNYSILIYEKKELKEQNIFPDNTSTKHFFSSLIKELSKKDATESIALLIFYLESMIKRLK